MFIIIWIVLIVALCWFCPWWIGAIIWVVNLFVPDMVPFIDELLSLPGPIKKWLEVAKAARTCKRVKDKIDGND